MPYNIPDLGNEPLFYIEMTSTKAGGTGVNRVNKLPKGYSADPNDELFWQSKLVNAALVPYLPYFSNCEGFDTRIFMYDLFEQ